MLLKNNNNEIIKDDKTNLLFQWDEEQKYGKIGFITNDINFIEKAKSLTLRYIIYDGYFNVKDEETSEIVGCVFIKFINMPKMLLETIYNHISDLLEQRPNSNPFIILDNIISLFNKFEISDNIVNELINNYGLCALLLKAKEKNIDLEKYLYQEIEKNKNKIYLKINNKTIKHLFMENLNKIKISEKDLIDKNNTIYIIIKSKFLTGYTNIIDAYKQLNPYSNIMKEILEMYDFMYQLENDLVWKELINTHTLNIPIIDTFIIDNNVLPDIDVINRNNMTNLTVEIDISLCKRIDINNLKKYF